MICPKCGWEQPQANVCQRCKIIIAKYRPSSSTQASSSTISPLTTMTQKIKRDLHDIKTSHRAIGSSYEATRGIARLFAGIGWTFAGIGFLCVVSAFWHEIPLTQLLLGVFGGISLLGGLGLVMVGQLTQAIVDIATSNQQILIELQRK